MSSDIIVDSNTTKQKTANNGTVYRLVTKCKIGSDPKYNNEKGGRTE
jgi:hypothetical protein